MHSLAVLVERLKQNAKLHSLKLFMRVLKIYVRGGNEGREGRGGKGEEGKRGEGKEGREREERRKERDGEGM